MGFYQSEKLAKLMVAPNGARKIKKDHPAVSLDKHWNILR